MPPIPEMGFHAIEPTGVVTPLPLVGRSQEMLRLDAMVESVSAGSGRIAVITGEAGIGKSRLAAEMVIRCATQGFQVFAGTADEVEQRRPFGVVADALGIRARDTGTAVEISRLLSGRDAGSNSGYGVEIQIADRFVQLVADACKAGPAVIVLDNLQWADESSLVAMKGLADLVPSHALLLACVLRMYPASRPLRALLAALNYRRAHQIRLEGLAPAEVADLAQRLAGAPAGHSVVQFLAHSGGNPFYVLELLTSLLNDRVACISREGTLELTVVGLPPSLRLTILEQLRFLPDPALEVLRAASVVGRSFTFSDVALISPTMVADVSVALEPALRSGIVVTKGNQLAFRHDLIREAIYLDQPLSVRTGLHRFLASRLAESGAEPQRVAAQLMLGAQPGDLDAVDWLCRAAAETTVSSTAIAAELLSRALELAGSNSARRMPLLGQLVRPLLWTGQATRAEEICTEALGAGPPAGEAPLFWLGLSTARLVRGRFIEARHACSQAQDCAELTESDRLYIATSDAIAGIFMGDPAALKQARQIVATAPRSISRGTALDGVAQWELFTGYADRAIATFEQWEAVTSPPEVANRIWQGSGVRVRIGHALALLDLDRLDEAAEMLERELSAKIAVPGLPHAYLGVCRYHAGRFDEAVRECRAAVTEAEAVGSFVPASAPALAAIIALRQGRVAEAGHLLERAEHVGTPTESGADILARWARTLVLEATGATEEAGDAAADADAAYLRVGFASYLAWHAPDFVRVALAAGRRAQAETAVQVAEAVAEQLPVASRRAGARRARGLLEGDTAALLDAVDACRQVPRPVDLALALRDAAAGLAGDGERERARAMAAESLTLVAGMGAAGDERNARALWRLAGLAPSARARHTRAKQGWDSLTPAELGVVDMLAEGHSNPEIAQALYLSRRTVGWHLSNAFRKLGVSSRVELVTEALRRDPALRSSAAPQSSSGPASR